MNGARHSRPQTDLSEGAPATKGAVRRQIKIPEDCLNEDIDPVLFRHGKHTHASAGNRGLSQGTGSGSRLVRYHPAGGPAGEDRPGSL